MTNTTQNSSVPPASDATPSFSEGGAGVQPKKRSAARFITPVLALVAALGVGVLGGVLIGQNSSTAAEMPGDAPTGGFGGGFTSGTVTAIDGDTVTLELDDGSTVTITTTDDTTVTTTQDSSVSELAEGDSLTVIGEADDDGNVAATSITEGATGFGGVGPGVTPPGDAPAN